MTRPRIIATMIWYEENPAWLAATVASAARFCDHIVAVDGAFALFPGGLDKPCSGAEQAEVILETAHGAGIGATVHVPRAAWYGGEVEKRSFMLALAGLVGTPYDDWVFTLDADEVVTHVAADLHDQLEATEYDVASVGSYWNDGRSCMALPPAEEEDRREAMQAGSNPVKHLMRLLPGLRVEGAHWIYAAEKYGEKVWLQGVPRLHPTEPHVDLSQFICKEHRHAWRGKGRQQAAGDYYKLRDEVGAEKLVTVYMEGLDGRPVEVRR